MLLEKRVVFSLWWVYFVLQMACSHEVYFQSSLKEHELRLIMSADPISLCSIHNTTLILHENTDQKKFLFGQFLDGAKHGLQ